MKPSTPLLLLFSLIVSTAYASGHSGGGDIVTLFGILIAFIVAIVFLLISLKKNSNGDPEL